jgi:hypothetical protein
MLDSAMERDLQRENCEKLAPNLAAAFRGHKGDRSNRRRLGYGFQC